MNPSFNAIVVKDCDSLIQFLLNSESVNRLYFTNSSFFHTNNPFFNGDGQIRLNENDAFGLFCPFYRYLTTVQVW